MLLMSPTVPFVACDMVETVGRGEPVLLAKDESDVLLNCTKLEDGPA